MVNKILITGNGFDLYHGLPTRYTDFLKFAKFWNTFFENYNADDKKKENDYIDVRLGENGELIEDTLYDFAKGLSFDKETVDYLNLHLKSNVWIKLFQDSHDKVGWVDFELQIQETLKTIEFFYKKYLPRKTDSEIILKDLKTASIQKVIKEFGAIAGSKYVDYINKVLSNSDLAPEVLSNQEQLLIDVAKKEMETLISCLRYYLMDFVSRINIKVVSEQIKEIGTCNVLNFNYTYTYRRLYRSYQREEGQYHEIHGEVKEDNLVLGIDDNAFNDLKYIYFAKFFQRIQKRTGSFYKEWIPDADCGHDVMSSDVYIIGLSLGLSDQNIIKEIFENEYVNSITIFYNNQKSFESMVINLVAIFGKEYVISQTGNERIKFVKLKEPINM